MKKKAIKKEIKALKKQQKKRRQKMKGLGEYSKTLYQLAEANQVDQEKIDSLKKLLK